MSRRNDTTRQSQRSGSPAAQQTFSRADSITSTGTAGLTNSRTRIVGNRTGVLADAVVGVVRIATHARGYLARGWGRFASVVTPLGWSMAGVVPLSFLFGYSFGWLELIVVAWAGTVMIVVAIIYLIGRSSLAMELRVAHSRVVVGERAVGEVLVSNPRHRRTFGATIEIPVGSGLAEITMPGLGRDGVFSQEFVIPTLHRGIIPVGPVRTVRADPIGLVRRELLWTEQSELFVHPRTIGIPSTSTGFVRDLEGNPTRDLSASDISFHALREYQPGDDRRYIHWRSTAKTGTYMVRQFEETRRSHLLIALSLAEGDYANEDEFEMAVSVTGSLGARAIVDARTVAVVVSERTPEFAKRKTLAVRPLSTLTRSRLLDDLAVVDRAPTALAITDVARVTADRVSGISVAFLVCGSTVTASELRSASTKFPTGVEVVAIVCDPESIPGLRRVAGLSVFTIGFLEDLQKSLARAAAA
ncbi:MAG: hypothetical protein JWR53_671 [Glaciihabitans sp.]|nr:hypothetical protein [Glaciihabitans sp.]MDQ1556162.1 hypothetical protein [Actinomycetota bacterium]